MKKPITNFIQGPLSILCERLKPIVEKLIGHYQCGFSPGKYTMDQIFTLFTTKTEKEAQEKEIDIYHLFVDCKGNTLLQTFLREHKIFC